MCKYFIFSNTLYTGTPVPLIINTIIQSTKRNVMSVNALIISQHSKKCYLSDFVHGTVARQAGFLEYFRNC